MRRFRFRAWDYENKKLIYPDGMYGNDWGDNTEILASLLAGEMNGVSDEYQEQYEVTQFIGLKDMVGREIYEGDILEILAENQEINRLVIKFGLARRRMYIDVVDIPCFYFELITTDVKNTKTFPIVINWNGVHDLDMLQVIGNIYENPELLKEE